MMCVARQPPWAFGDITIFVSFAFMISTNPWAIGVDTDFHPFLVGLSLAHQNTQVFLA